MQSIPARTLAALIVLAIFTASCGDGGEPSGDASGLDDGASRDTTGGSLWDRSACAELVLPQRFGFRWREVNHRLSKWDLGLTDTPEGACRPRLLRTELVGGTFSTGNSDIPTLRYGFQDRLAPTSRRLGAARRNLKLEIGADGTAEGSRTFDRDDLDLENYPRVVAFVEGFRLDTDVDQPDSYPEDYDPAHGYTVRGVGASVEISRTNDESIELDYRLRYEPGLSPDRPKLNRAIPHARIAGRLDILLVGTTAPVASGSVEYSKSYPMPETGQDDTFEPPPTKKRRVALAGEAGAPAGLYGLSSFDFTLSPEIDCDEDKDCPAAETCKSDGSCTRERGEPGFYVREIAVDVKLENYSRSSGDATFLLTGFASNSTKFVGFWPMQSEFSGSLRWIQAEGASTAVRYDTEFQTGTFEVPLLEMAN